jgi:hypothetical protein
VSSSNGCAASAATRLEGLLRDKTRPSRIPALTPEVVAWVANRLQEKVRGGLAPKAVREIETMIRQLDRTGAIKTPTSMTLKAGTQLIREWHGAAHQVLMLDDGYLYRDERFGSLSEIARRITGTQWSGPRFFGLARNGAAAKGASA